MSRRPMTLREKKDSGRRGIWERRREMEEERVEETERKALKPVVIIVC